MSKVLLQRCGVIKDTYVTANTISNMGIGQMTSTENTKKDESDGEDESEECQEDGRNGADYRGNNPVELVVD